MRHSYLRPTRNPPPGGAAGSRRIDRGRANVDWAAGPRAAQPILNLCPHARVSRPVRLISALALRGQRRQSAAV